MGGGVTQVGGATTVRLATLIAARLIHDLGGPLGGLGAVLAEAAEDKAALGLANDAATVLRRRLALFRAAWAGEPPPLDRAGLLDLAAGLPNAPRLHVIVEALAQQPPFAPAAAQVIANVLLLAAESLPGGGMLALAGNPAGTVVVTIAGPRAAWPAGLGAMLADPAAAWAAVAALELPGGLKLLPAPLTALLARAAGVRASLLLAGSAEPVPPLLLDLSASSPA